MHKTRWARLPFGVRMTIGSLALLLPTVGGVFGVGAIMGESGAETVDRYTSIVTSDSNARSNPDSDAVDPADPALNGISAGIGGAPGLPAAVPAGTAPGVHPDATGTSVPAAGPGGGSPTGDPGLPMGGTPVDPGVDPGPGNVPPSPPAPQPVVVVSLVTETEAIQFDTEFIKDPSMPRRTHEERVAGEQGVKTFTYEVTTTDGQQTGKRLVSEEVTRAAVNRVIAIGTGRRDCDDDGPGSGGDGSSGGSSGGGNWGDRRCDNSPGS